MRTLFSFLILLISIHGYADCKSELLNIVKSSINIIRSSDLDPRCKNLGLIGGKQNCINAGNDIWELKVLVEPVMRRASSHCQQQQCSQNKNLCLDLLDDESHIVAVGVYGLIGDIEAAPWRTLASAHNQ